MGEGNKETRHAASRPGGRKIWARFARVISLAGARLGESVTAGAARRNPHKYKSPEVMLISFVSASSSRLDPHSTCSRRFLAGCNARSSLGLRAHRQPDKPVQRLGTLSCLRAFVLVLLDQRFAIDPCEPSLVSFESSVISLEPRTLHQPAKLKNVPKNEYVSTLFKFFVNQNYAFLSIAKSIECSWFTARCCIFVQSAD